MFNLIGNLTKATVALAVTPVALAVDVALLPKKLVSDDPNEKAFAATEGCLKVAADAADKAGKP